MVGRPPLELAVEIADASGTQYRWDSSGRPDDRPQGIGFGTKRGDGFAQGGCTLARRVDDERTDVRLKNEIAFVGADGSVAYEGRVAATPRSFGTDGHSMSVSAAGWMSYAKQRKFSEVYVDRSFSWQDATLARRVQAAATVSRGRVQAGVSNDGIRFDAPNEALGTGEGTELQYDAGSGNTIAKWQYRATDSTMATNWEAATLFLAGSDAFSSSDSYALTLDGTLRTVTPTTARRWLMLRALTTGAVTPPAGSTRRYSAVGAFGSHGVTTRNTSATTPDGFYASDVIRNIAERFCPKLDTSGVQDTTHVIPHLVFERTFPYDAWLEINKYHLWDLGVWENKTLHFGATDLTDYDWELRLDDPGVTVDFQGDTTEDLFNGIVVTYTDVDTGRTEVLTPDDDSTLADTSVTNPANMWGEDQWDEATISIPTDAAGAAQIGRALLAEKNSPKAPGTYRVTGHIKDRAGHWQQVWKVRAGDTIAITSSNSLSDRPHLIVETNYTHDDYTVQIGVDNTLPRVDAFMDRAMTALQANNLI